MNSDSYSGTLIGSLNTPLSNGINTNYLEWPFKKLYIVEFTTYIYEYEMNVSCNFNSRNPFAHL